MQIYLMRHGLTEYNLTGRFTGRADVPLHPDGAAQAEQVHEMLKNVQFDRVIASSQQRAVRTAQIVAPGHPVEAMEELVELDVGTWTGHTWAEVEEMDPEGARRHEEDWTAAVGGGETADDMFERVGRAVREVLATSALDDTVLIVSHGGPMRVLATLLLDLPKEVYWHLVAGQGSYSLLTAYPESPLWFSIAEWNSRRIR
ncbi:MAG: histidine phosphatase family protein [Clostridiales bacterium]|nr:histidine phosphatase family protein [Clostridiales bacterium]